APAWNSSQSGGLTNSMLSEPPSSGSARSAIQKRGGPKPAPILVADAVAVISRARRVPPAVEAEEVAVPGRGPSRGSASHPGRSALPEAAVEVVAAGVAEAAVEAAEPDCR